MASRTDVVTTFEPEKIIQPIYTGGDVALDQDGRILVTSLGEDALLTDIDTGVLLARIAGVGDYGTNDCLNVITADFENSSMTRF